MNINNCEFFCSFSGGKDSTLALYRAIKSGGICKKIFTMMSDNEDRSRAHGLKKEILEAQAASMEIPLVTGNASWEDYEKIFISILKDMEKEGIKYGVFGDIDIEAHKQWETDVCQKANMEAFLPIWQEDRLALVYEFIDSGFKAMIVSVKNSILPQSLLGKILNRSVVEEIMSYGADGCGENGEYHTVVIDGPIFKKPILLDKHNINQIYDCSVLDLSIADK